MTDAPALRLGTRRSLLARTQSRSVADAITAATGRAVELVEITSAGDVLTGPLASIGGTGVFVTALRDALLRGECDLLVHSMKDLPTTLHPGIRIAAVPPRASARDALCARDGLTLAQLPAGARVGTGSPRRVAQLRERRADLVVTGIRGNVDTRLRTVADGTFDAVVLAEAGLARIGREGVITEILDAPGAAAQGALAVEIRAADADGPLGAAVRSAGDADAATTALLERAVLRRLEAGCAAPVGIEARRTGDAVHLLAVVYAPDGARSVRVERRLSAVEVADPAGRDAVGVDVADALLAAGAAELADLREAR